MTKDKYTYDHFYKSQKCATNGECNVKEFFKDMDKILNHLFY